MKNTHKNKGIFFKENKLAKFTLSGDLIKKYVKSNPKALIKTPINTKSGVLFLSINLLNGIVKATAKSKDIPSTSPISPAVNPIS